MRKEFKCYYSIADKVMEKGQLMICDITPHFPLPVLKTATFI